MRDGFRGIYQAGLDVPKAEVSSADLYEHPNDASHHLPEKVGSSDAIEDQVCMNAEFGTSHFNEGGSFLLHVVAKSPEIVPPGKQSGGCGHRFDVETILHPPDERLGEGPPPQCDLVEIEALLGIVPRVETRGSFTGFQDVYI